MTKFREALFQQRIEHSRGLGRRQLCVGLGVSAASSLTLVDLAKAQTGQAPLVSRIVEVALPSGDNQQILKAIANDWVWVTGTFRGKPDQKVMLHPHDPIEIVGFKDTHHAGRLVLPLFTRKEYVTRLFRADESLLWIEGRVALGLASSAYTFAVNVPAP